MIFVSSRSRECCLISWNRIALTARKPSFRLASRKKICNWIPFQNPSEAQRKEHDKFEFALHEVYAVDVLISSGEGQGREKDAKITIYKKTEDT